MDLPKERKTLTTDQIEFKFDREEGNFYVYKSLTDETEIRYDKTSTIKCAFITANIVGERYATKEEIEKRQKAWEELCNKWDQNNSDNGYI